MSTITAFLKRHSLSMGILLMFVFTWPVALADADLLQRLNACVDVELARRKRDRADEDQEQQDVRPEDPAGESARGAFHVVESILDARRIRRDA